MKFKTIVGRSFKKRVQTKDLTIITSPDFELLSSSIYPLYFEDDLNLKSENISGRLNIKEPEGFVVRRYDQDNTISSIKTITGFLKKVLQITKKEEDHIIKSIKTITGSLRDLLKTYSFKEDFVKTSLSSITGALVSKLILYFIPPEKVLPQIKKIEVSTSVVSTSSESFLFVGNIQRASRMSFRSLQTFSSISTFVDNNTVLVFKEPFINLDPHNIILVFGKQINKEEPEVIVNANTTSALDFEEGLIDKIPTTLWKSEGISLVQNTNKIFGKNSFETKALGDSLYTTSDIITGDSTLFTVEFYVVLKGNTRGYFPLFSDTNNQGGGEQQVGVTNAGFLNFQRAYSFGTAINISSLHKIEKNTIYKVTVTYDGSAIRYFIDNKLCFVVGISKGWIPRNNLRFFRTLVRGYEEYQHTTIGLLDNINIFDGECRQVRDTDPYADNLIVDLAFDGENNSTKIVDNSNPSWISMSPINYTFTNKNFKGTEVSNIVITPGSSPFGDTSAKFNNSYIIHNNSEEFNLTNKDFTISCWVKFDSDYLSWNNYPSIIAKRYSGLQWDWGIEANCLNKSISFVYNDRNYVTITTDLVFNTWNHVCVTCKNGILKTFYNGKLFATASLVQPIYHTTSRVLVGKTSESYEDNYLKGYLKDLLFINGYCMYDDTFDLPITPMKVYNNWKVNGNAKISTDQKFDGFSSLYFDSAGYVSSQCELNLNRNFTISFEYIRKKISSAAIIDYRSSVGVYSGFLLTHPSVNNNKMNLYFNGNNSSWQVNLITNSDILIDKTYKIDIVCSNNNVSIYINGVLDISESYNEDVILSVASQRLLTIGRNISGGGGGLLAYIKNFKIYKDVAIIPENPTGKIQLDFDNNVVDKYGNSTWINNNVTFDQVNSVQGYAANYNGDDYTYIYTNTNENLNFEDKNYKITLDFKEKNVNRNYCMLLSSNDTSYQNGLTFQLGHGNMNGLYVRVDNKIDITTNIKVVNETYYNTSIERTNNVHLLKLNNVIVGAYPNATTFSINNNGTRLGGIGWGSGFNTNGYIDNFKTYKNYTGEIDVKQTAIHLPLETNNTNIGFTSLTINAVGNPIYTTIDNKKCIKFESGKYLAIASNNIFHLGTDSDFYIEFDFYWNKKISENNYPYLLADGSYSSGFRIVIGSENELIVGNAGGNKLTIDYALEFNKFYTYKVRRKGTKVSSLLYNSKGNLLSSITDENSLLNFNFSTRVTYIGGSSTFTNTGFDGYLSNFKMFVGTSEIPETYNDKKVLDLDFKPTRQSYLFKDNNNNCVIHPLGITQRDYQNSKYCVYLDNTNNQYLKLTSPLLNLSTDDFIFKFVIKQITSKLCYLISSKDNQNSLRINLDNSISVLDYFSNVILTTTSGVIKNNTIQTILFYRNRSTISINIDGINFETNSSNSLFNFNNSGEGYLGNNFNGYLYSIKTVRNTQDFTLVEDEEDGGEEEQTNLKLFIEDIDDIINPEGGERILVKGFVQEQVGNVSFTVTKDGQNIPIEEVNTRIEGTNLLYDFKINSDLIEDGVRFLVLKAQDSLGFVTKSFRISIKRNSLTLNDLFNVSWYQNNLKNTVSLVKILNKDMMYFDGISSVYSTNYMWNFGLQPFTFEFNIVVNSHREGYLFSYGRTASNERWYDFRINNNGTLSFLVKGVVLVTTTLIVPTDKLTRISITRNKDFMLRIFIDGKESGSGLVNKNFIKPVETTITERNNVLFLGRSGSRSDNQTSVDFVGYLSDFYINSDTCLYTEDYTVEELIKQPETKSLLNFINTDANFIQKEDNYNSLLSWNNTECVIENNSLVLKEITNSLTSSSNTLGLFNKENWTIDIRATASQLNTGSVLFDSRISSSLFKGILIEQPNEDPTSLTINIGLFSNTAQQFNYSLNTGRDKVKLNEEFSLKITKNQTEVILFFNGIVFNRTNIGVQVVNLNDIVTLGNNRENNKAFIGKIREYRLIKGSSSDVYNYVDNKKENFK